MRTGGRAGFCYSSNTSNFYISFSPPARKMKLFDSGLFSWAPPSCEPAQPFTRQLVWGPHYWFVLHSIARTYPEHPNEVVRRKYYDFIQNLPLFLPDEEIGTKFSHLLDTFPVSPYLRSRDSFMRWMYFIHNKINRSLEKDEPTFEEAMRTYDDLFRPPVVVTIEKFRFNRHHYFVALLVIGAFVIWWANRPK